MSSTIPTLKLFPLYPGGPVVQANSGSLNANSSFYTRATQFSSAYGVNTTPASNPNDTSYYYTLRENQTIARRPVSEASIYNTNLALGREPGSFKTVAAPAVAPSIPDLYRKAVELLSISDLKFSDLMALPEFRIPGVGMGLKVTTDGMGNVDSMAIDPSSRGLLPARSAIGPAFGSPNMAEITEGATFKTMDPGFNVLPESSLQPGQTPKPNLKQAIVQNDLLNNLPQFNMNRLNRDAGIFNVDRLNSLGPGGMPERLVDALGRNPVLDRLYQMETPDNGLPVAGYDAALNAEQARQLAATQARLNVSTGERTRQNVAEIVGASTRQAESYAVTFRPQMDQVMNGKVNVQPWGAGASTGQGGMGSSGGSAFELGASVADAMARKSSGAYIPFRMQPDTQGQGGDANPFLQAGNQGSGMGFGGSGQQSSLLNQNRQPRRPLAFTA